MRPRGVPLAGFLGLAAVTAGLAQYGDISDLKIAKPEDKVDVKSTPPPKGAVILFDGKNLDAWVKTNGKDKPAWELKDGGAAQVKGGGIMTRDRFDGPFKLHVEFRVPYLPKEAGQKRGNSGVYVQGRYEVQVLDSYGLQSKNNDCGAIYEVAAPLVNACKAPTVWHNGVKIHDDVKIASDNTRAGLGGDPSQPGPIMLQDHGDPVQYRNLWLLPGK